jgi:hypothetical protein
MASEQPASEESMGIQITGYHGTTRAIANLATTTPGGKRHLKMSHNRYDWLGAGIYFWQDAPERARQWGNTEIQRSGSGSTSGD